MIELKVCEVASSAGGEAFSIDPEAVVNGFSIDSRAIMPGQFFIAIKGERFDGHDFLEDAAAGGAAGLIVEPPLAKEFAGKVGHVIVVENTRKAMGRIAAAIRSRSDIPVVCVTGTNGKTTVKEILSQLLSRRYNVLKSPKSYNNIIGLSLTLFGLEKGHDAAVLELGTNHPGEISELAAIAGPRMAIITNIGNGHLESFLTREGVLAEKISLLDSLREDGTAFLNRDDELLRKKGAGYRNVKYFGMSPECEFGISGISRRGDGYDFSCGGERYFSPLEGVHNIYNAAAAIGAARYLGVSCDEIRERLAGFSGPGMRLEKVEINGITFMNDSYNANPDSFECALRVLSDGYDTARKGVAAGDMMELGPESDNLHRAVGTSVAEKGFDFLVVCGEKAAHIAEGAIMAGMERDKVFYAGSRREAAELIGKAARPGTVVLLKGSRASKMEEVLKCFTTYCTL
ncbi:MAG: UDP-N-acetylmuramoyl-tripeptide--D-alanyl-D-alanine ligase [Candidatus Omnitrophota bacterium]